MYLVTGGAGFIGSNIVRDLVLSGRRVAVNDTIGSDDKWKNLAKSNVHDFITPADLDGWLIQHGHKLEGIVHMGAVSSTTERDCDLILASNFTLSLKLWDWCARHGVAFIYASSAATYGNGAHGFDDDWSATSLANLRPLNPYGWSKLAFDRRVRAAVDDAEPQPPKWAGLKFFNVYGPNEYHKGSMRSLCATSFDRLAVGESLKLFKSYRHDYADGEQKRDFVYVKDCSSIVLWMLEHSFPSGIYNVGSGRASSWLQVARAMFKALERPERIEFVEMPAELRRHYQYHTEARIDRLREIGYASELLTVEEGIRDYVQNYLASEDRYR